MIKQKLIKNLSNIPGWCTNKKYIVLESDDWGSIRMPSNETKKELIQKEVLSSNKTSHFNLYDCLESNDDLLTLFDVLSEFTDKRGNHPVFTGLNVVANPDFEKIKRDDFKHYHYEPFNKTLKRYGKHDRVLDLWKEGAQKRLFVPQFHGREHLNVTSWMKALQNQSPKTRTAFEYGFWGFDPVPCGESSITYQAAFDIDEPEEVEYLKSVVNEGIDLFKELVGYAPEFFVPTNGSFNLALLEKLKEKGIEYVLLDKLQKEPLGHGKFKTHFRYLGKKSKFDQIFLSRNAAFEPSAGGKDWIDSCLNDISTAFRWRKPATISTHRVNYIGYLDPKNRDNGIKQLRELLKQILKKWPEVEFITSVELGHLIRQSGYQSSAK